MFSSPFNHNRTIYHLTFYTLQALDPENPPSTRNKIPNFHSHNTWLDRENSKAYFHQQHCMFILNILIFVKPSLTGEERQL